MDKYEQAKKKKMQIVLKYMKNKEMSIVIWKMKTKALIK